MRRRRPEVPPCPDPLVTYDESAWPSWDAWFTARCAWLDDHGQPWDDLGPIPDEPFDVADI